MSMKVTLPTADELWQAGLKRNSQFPYAVAMAYHYAGPIWGIDTRFAFAQMLHETGYWTFTGEVKPEWNNPAGLRAKGDFLRFGSINEGVYVHLGKLRCYFADHNDHLCALVTFHGAHFKPGQTIGMPRMLMPGGLTVDRSVTADDTGHLNLTNNSYELDGRWAQGPSAYGYGDRVTAKALEI